MSQKPLSALSYQMMIEKKLSDMMELSLNQGDFIRAFYFAINLAKFVGNNTYGDSIKVFAEECRKVGLSYC